MGLDMYLYAKQFLSKYGSDAEQEKANKIRALFPEIPLSDNLYSVQVRFEIGYWRKANAIHKWFVDNVQDGVDDCQYSYVERSKLEELLKICQNVTKNKKSNLLPPQEGFFFGSTEIDEGYWEDIQQTIEIIERYLKLPDSFEFEYHSSW